MTLKAVFFDAGETLVHPHPSFPELFALVLEREGVSVDADAFRGALHLVANRFTEAAKAGEVWSADAERSKVFWLEIYTLLLSKLGVADVESLALKLYVEFTDLANYRLFPDVETTLAKLEAAGLRLGIVSNFEEWLERLLEQLGVIRFFDVRIISGVEGVEKPDPRIFRLALERAGVEPHESAYVGDNPEFDTEPAESLGMLGVLIDRRDRFPDHSGPRIATLEDLPAVLGLGEPGRESVVA
jgi:putative hydrolase of the HAD superfamily